MSLMMIGGTSFALVLNSSLFALFKRQPTFSSLRRYGYRLDLLIVVSRLSCDHWTFRKTRALS